MQYVVTILVDGRHVATSRFVNPDELEFITGLSGPLLWDFSTALKLTGKAMDVQRDESGVTVVIAHEEI